MSDGVETDIVTQPVGIELVSIDRLVSRGSLRAVTRVIITIGDIEIAISGIGIMRDSDNGWFCRCPQYRNSNGVWSNAIELPQSVLNSVLELVSEQLEYDADPRNCRP